jgi:hypothetical protein
MAIKWPVAPYHIVFLLFKLSHSFELSLNLALANKGQEGTKSYREDMYSIIKTQSTPKLQVANVHVDSHYSNQYLSGCSTHFS